MGTKLKIAICLLGLFGGVVPYGGRTFIEANRIYSGYAQKESIAEEDVGRRAIADFLEEEEKWFGRNDMALANFGAYIETDERLKESLTTAQEARKERNAWGGILATYGIALGTGVGYLMRESSRKRSTAPKGQTDDETPQIS
jgi:hypothetical protein